MLTPPPPPSRSSATSDASGTSETPETPDTPEAAKLPAAGPLAPPAESQATEQTTEQAGRSRRSAPRSVLPGDLALRLLRGAPPAAVLGQVLAAAASAGAGFLLLASLGQALQHPQHSEAALARLVWCAVPLAAAVLLTVAVTGTGSAARPHPGFVSAGIGPGRSVFLTAASAALTGLVGCAAALAAFLAFRQRLAGPQPLPDAGVLTLLAVVPLASVAATVAAGWFRGRRIGVPGPSWAVAAVAAGLGLELFTSRPARSGHAVLLPLPGGLTSVAPGPLLGWALALTGLALAGPGLVGLCGRLLAARRPGAVRLLAGRTSQAEAPMVGLPLGVLCAVAAAAPAASRLHAPGARPTGPLAVLGAALVVVSVAATVLVAAGRARQERAAVSASLSDIGASASLLRRALALRVLALLVVLAPLTWLIGTLAALPLTS